MKTPNRYRDNDPTHLQHVLWMGGSPCSGKSSIADMLSARYNVKTYHVDEAFQQYIPSFTSDLYPICYKWTHTPWQDLWMQTQETLLRETIEAYTEHLRFIFSDLQKINIRVIAEGTSLLPDYISQIITEKSRAIWVVPTEDFQRKVYPNRGPFVNNILQQCENPQQALQNWMDRDVAFARWVEARAKQLHLKCLQVDGQHSIAEIAALVATHFKLDKS